MSVRGPWYITLRALEQYLSLMGIDPATCTDQEMTAAENELIAMATWAVTLHDEVTGAPLPGVRAGKPIANGMLQYRGPKPAKLTLTVNPAPRAEGDLPQLVGVTGRPINRRKP